MYETQSFPIMAFEFQSSIYQLILIHYVAPLLTHVPLATHQSLSCALKVPMLVSQKDSIYSV